MSSSPLEHAGGNSPNPDGSPSATAGGAVGFGGAAEEQDPIALKGLSTSVANQRLVEEVELVVGRFLAHVKTVNVHARVSFLQSHEGAVTPMCIVVLSGVWAYTLQWAAMAEVLLVLPFHLLAWYISFRLPRVEQMRAIAKVQDCLQRFCACEDAFSRSVGTVVAACRSDDVPPSAFCVSVLRDRVWRQIPYNMVVEGDVFKLRDGDSLPCKAERLSVRPPHGAVPTGEVFSAGERFAPERMSSIIMGSFRALATACVPSVHSFLHSSQRSSEGRMDTVFFELADILRGRLRRVSIAAFLLAAVAIGAWTLRTEVAEQGLHWHLNRALLPFRLLLCLVPLMPAILLQITDVWGNARIQSLFEWGHDVASAPAESSGGGQGLRESGNKSAGQPAIVMGSDSVLRPLEVDASQVPLQQQVREFFDILRGGLDGPSNLMHTLNSTTVVAFCDKEGLLTDTCSTIDEVCVCAPQQAALFSAGSKGHLEAAVPLEDTARESATQEAALGASEASGAGLGLAGEDVERTASSSTFRPVVLDVQNDPLTSSGLRFESSEWTSLLPSLKPLGLAMAVSRQPRGSAEACVGQLGGLEGACGDCLDDPSVCDFLGNRGTSAGMRDCLCIVSRLIGFKDEVMASFQDVKFSMELAQPGAPEQEENGAPTLRPSGGSVTPSGAATPHPSGSVSAVSIAGGAQSFGAASGAAGAGAGPVSPRRPQQGGGAANPSADPSGGTNAVSETDVDADALASQKASRKGVEEKSEASVKERELGVSNPATTNLSQTLMTWLVQDARDGSFQMFCKAKAKRLLPRCTHYFDGRRVCELQEQDRQALMRLVLQWKSSGLSAMAFSYRPLMSQPELEVAMKLEKRSVFCSMSGLEGELKLGEVHGGLVTPDSHMTDEGRALARAVTAIQSEQVLVGMAGVKLPASVQMASYAEALQTAGIRFQVYSIEGDKRTRTLGGMLGLETGWNCMISLEPKMKEFTNMMGQVVLPSGITKIRTHVKDVDNVPLLVSLYSKATPWRVQQMFGILQENAEVITCVGSALRPNFETFRQANTSVSVLVDAVPQCRRCLGRREPRPGQLQTDHDLLASGTVNQAEFQLSADLTSLPCALQARHSYCNGEQRTLGVLFNAIKEARRCVDCILMVLIHYVCGAAELAVMVALQVLFCLPPPMEGAHMVAVLFLILPVLSIALLFNPASPKLMKELPLKKADEKTLAQPNRLVKIYAIRSIPSALVVVAAFLQDLHRMVSWQLDQARHLATSDSPSAAAAAAAVVRCADFELSHWFTGRWPRCTTALSRVLDVGQADAIVGSSGSWRAGDGSSEVSCSLVHAQQWSAMLFIVYEVALAFTFLDRYDSLATRGPASNKVLCGVALFVLLVHSTAGWAVVHQACGGDWHQVVPSWATWLVFVFVWPCLAVVISECAKRRDRRYHMHLQRTMRVLFNTRLGMWSPK